MPTHCINGSLINSHMITITESAKNKIAEVLSEENNPKMRLRMYVQGGGCSGMSYGFTLDDEQNEDDFEIPAGSSSVLVDSMSLQYVSGSEVDYVDDLQGSRFSIKNPAAVTTCGCGSSFSV
jgi:iron-sulfur cluster insertion protein